MESSFHNEKTGKLQLIVIALVTLLGSILRLRQLASQVIGDDEWHAVKVASQSSYGYILTHFNQDDNCIPLTFIDKVFMDTVGLNEITLHILQAMAGIGIILIFSHFAARLVGRHAATIFAFLLSVSPLLVYYSRFARPYIFVVFLSFGALLSFYFWLQTKKTRYLASYLAGSALCAYFSQVSFPSLAAPLLFSLLYWAWHRRKGGPFSLSLKEILGTGALLGAGILLWLLPTWSSLGAITSKVGEGAIGAETVAGFLRMFGGFGSLPLALTFVALFAVGIFYLYRVDRYFLSYLATVIALQMGAVLLSNPYRVELPHVFTRYVISCLPIYLLVISTGLWYGVSSVSAKGKTVAVSAATVFLLALYLFGSPLATIYAGTNSFSNHDDFQYGYRSEIFDKAVAPEAVSPFYRELREQPAGTSIIEYPYVLWWSGNYYHFYQQYHQKPVRIGYWSPFYFWPPMVTDQKVKLANFVDLASRDALLKSGAKYVVIHKDMAWEAVYVRDIFGGGNGMESSVVPNFFEGRYGAIARFYARESIASLSSILGRPCYEDKWITVFKIL